MKTLRALPSRQGGFSLVELMVATLLGLILTAGVVSLYLASRKDYGLNNALGAVQGSGRLALAYLEPKIRMAGYFGCAHATQPGSILKNTLATYSPAPALQGYEFTGTGMGTTYRIRTTAPSAATNAASWSPSLPPDVSAAVGVDKPGAGGAVPGSDILLLHEATPAGIGLAAPYTDGADGLFVAMRQDAQLTTGELAIVSDCRHSDLFQITGITGYGHDGDRARIEHSSDAALIPGNDPPGKFNDDSYGEDSRILPYGAYLFYVGVGLDRGSSLYEVSLRNDGTLGKPVELVPGVETMQLLYGVDTDGDEIPNRFLTADQVGDWDRVVSVRIALMTQSAANSTDTAGVSSFKLLDPSQGLTLMVPRDGRLRRVFEETISIRNRLP